MQERACSPLVWWPVSLPTRHLDWECDAYGVTKKESPPLKRDTRARLRTWTHSLGWQNEVLKSSLTQTPHQNPKQTDTYGLDTIQWTCHSKASEDLVLTRGIRMADKSNHRILEKEVDMKEERKEGKKNISYSNELLNQISKIKLRNILLKIKAKNNKIKGEFTSYSINF